MKNKTEQIEKMAAELAKLVEEQDGAAVILISTNEMYTRTSAGNIHSMRGMIEQTRDYLIKSCLIQFNNEVAE